MDTGVNGINYGSGNYVVPKLLNPDGSSKIWTNPDPLAAEVHGWNYYGNNADCTDSNGHGTAIAGILAAESFSYDEDGSGTGHDAPTGNYQGVVPDAKILPIKLYQVTSGVAHWATKANLNTAFKWVYDHATDYNIASINMSWGFFGSTRSASDANPSLDDYNYVPTGGQSISWYIDHLRTDKNVLIVQAAGNSDNPGWANPGRETGETAIGSLNVDGTKVWGDDAQFEVQDTGAAYGQDADFIDIFAPGWNVTLNSTNANYTLQPGYTSFATPWIAGAAALLKQINPAITPDQIMTTLRNNNAGTLTDGRPNREHSYTWNANDPILNLNAAAGAAITATPAGQRGTFNDIQYDQAGNLHMAWYNDSAKLLMYAKRSTAGVWGTTQLIDSGAVHAGTTAPTTGVGEFVSLALDETNPSAPVPAVAYYSSDLADLMFAKQNGTSWNVATIESLNTVGRMPSLAYNPDTDLPAISYFYDNNGDLRLAEFNGSTWGVTSVQTTGEIGRYSRLAFHPGTRHWAIAYDDVTNTAAKYIQQVQSGQSWVWGSPQTVADNSATAVAFTDLKFDTVSNLPAVSFYYTANADLVFAQALDSSGANWSLPNTIGGVNGLKGLYTNLHFAGLSSRTGRALWDIVYYNKSNASVDVAQGNVTDSWTVTVGVFTGGGSNLSAEWRNGLLTAAYSPLDGSKLEVAADVAVP
jgi:hypothetical protein